MPRAVNEYWMAMITLAIPGTQGINDVLAYINTLQPKDVRTAMTN
jgi:hypothetical protein